MPLIGHAEVSPGGASPSSQPPGLHQRLRRAVQLSARRPDAQPPDPHERALLDALGNALARHPGSPFNLDLSNLAPQALALFTEHVAQALQRPDGHGFPEMVTSLVLPAATRDLPAGIRALSALQKLDLPGYSGTQLNLRGLLVGRTPLQPALWISTPGTTALREILVDSTQAACQQLRFQLRAAHPRKVALVDPEHRRPVPGLVYGREALRRGAQDPGAADQAFQKMNAINLNGQICFADSTELIWCRHLALAQEMRLIEHRGKPAPPEGERGPRLDYKDWATPDALQASMPASLEAQFNEICKRSRNNHLVALASWDQFLRSQFEAMAPDRYREFLVLSTNHAMHMELQVKPRAQGAHDADWVVAFYDPNRTVTLRRTVLDRSGAVPCTLASLMATPAHLPYYFGSNPKQGTALVIGVAQENVADSKHGGPQQRNVSVAHAGKLCTPQELFLRLEYGLHDGLTQRLEQALDDWQFNPPAVLELLQAKNVDGVPALFVALQNGHAPAAQALLDAVSQAAAGGRIRRPAVLKLLQAEPANNGTALSMAMYLGQAQAARALMDALIKAVDAGWIKPGQLTALLDASLPQTSSFDKVQGTVSPELMPQMLASLTQWARQSQPGGQVLRKFLLGSMESGRPLDLAELLARGHAMAAGRWADAVLELAKARPPYLAGVLGPLQLSAWLNEAASALAGALRSPGPSSVPVSGLADSLDVWVLAVLDSPLACKDKAALLEKRGTAPDSLLARLAAHPDRARAHREPLGVLIDSLVPPATDRKGSSLAPADTAALKGLGRTFMAANLHDWVDVLDQRLAASGLPPRSRAELLLASDAGKGASALSVALDRGNTLAVQAWMRAALALPLEPSAKRDLLAGGAADGPARNSRVSWTKVDPPTKLAWAQCLARAPDAQLPWADKEALLEAAQMSHLLEATVQWRPAPQAARPTDGKPQPAPPR